MKNVTTLPSPKTPPRLLLFDIDGTLVKKNHSIDQRIIDRLLQLERTGVSIGFATGRAYFGAKRILDLLPVNGPSMFFSGSLVCRPQTGEVLFEQGMTPEELSLLHTAAKRDGLYVEFYTRSGYFISEWNVLAELHSEYMGDLPQVADLEAISKNEKVLKAVMIGEEGVTTDAVLSVVQQHSSIPCGVSYGAAHPGILFANFTSAAASRPTALKVITETLGVDLSEIASFGDAIADVEFLSRVQFGVAMGNAGDEVKARSPYVTDPVEGAGVFPALEWLFGREKRF